MPDLFNILILLVVVWTVGRIFERLKLPIVFGELLGGILVGPALLDLVNTDSHAIEILAELGIFFLMLHAGLKTHHHELLESSVHSILIAIGGFILPFLGGYSTALLFGESQVSALLIAMGLSITALALATRIFKENGIEKSRVATLTMGAAIVGDILALVLFAVVINLSEQGSVDAMSVAWLLCKVLLFFSIIIGLGLKTSGKLHRIIYFGNKGFTLTLIIALLLGLIAEMIGLHMIIGAFMAGLFIREEIIDEKTFGKIEDRIYGLAYGFFGPIFFASLAFHLDLSAFNTAPAFLLSILIVAIIGKIAGAGGVAALLGLKRTEALLIGLAMNSRGAVELIIASIGLQLGIIDETVFSILVIMAFATTLFSIIATPPLARRLTAM